MRGKSMSEDTPYSDSYSDVRRYVGHTIREGDCDILRHLLNVGLDVNSQYSCIIDIDICAVSSVVYTD
jgi:hypothetical protein